MINLENLRQVLQCIGYVEERDGFYSKYFSNGEVMSVDFNNERLIYPVGVKAERETTLNFSQDENFVVFECVSRLIEKGYKSNHIVLEKAMPGGHHLTPGFCDIVVSDNNNRTILIIECKTAAEFDKYWKKTLFDGDQLFNYYNSFRQAIALCLYASDYSESGEVIYKSNIISMVDNDEYLAINPSLGSYAKVKEENGNKEDYFEVWKNTYQLDFETAGIFEDDIEAYTVGRKKYSVDELSEVDNESIQKKYHEFATILRQHNVGSHETAFDKLVNLYLAKIVDETINPDELQFRWKGAANDDYYSIQDRLQKLYKEGMEKYLDEEVTFIDQKDISDAFHLFKNDPDATRTKVLDYFRQLKFYTNSDFAFLDVHNKELFYKNAVVLKKMVQMLQDIRLKSREHNQFLGDLFEGFLDDGVKQSEGQYFTPTPIVKFMISSLPIEQLIVNSSEIPNVIDYACGAGHFLTEYASCVKRIVEKTKTPFPSNEYYQHIYGIEKEYRLSKVAKVSAFMYGFDDIQIIYGDALSFEPKIKDEKFSVLIANPPYSVKGFLETLTKEERERFTLFDSVADISKNNSIALFFFERAKQLLKGDGIAAIVLPSTVLTNENIFARCREILLKEFEIIAIASFGDKTFGKTGTNTISLFIRRKKNNPDISVHYKNRVEAWFSSDNSKDKIFEDNGIIEEYCRHVGIDYSEYSEWLKGGEVPSAPIFSFYTEDCIKSADYKKIEKRKINKKYSDSDKEKDIENCLDDYYKQIESEKLYYYMLARDNRQIVLVQCPATSKEMKDFLGYEWSDAKGNEGIKYLGSVVDEEDNTILKNRGIESIQTPMFNPQNYDDDEKINTIIRSNFLGESISVPDELSSVVTIGELKYMMDFSLRKFDKKIKAVVPKKIVVNSKYKLEPLSSLVDSIGGLWTGKKGPFKNVTVVRNTNFTKSGRIDFSKVKNIDVSESEYSKRTLQKGDIILEKSGGSNTQAVGRVVIYDQEHGECSFSNFTARLRIKSDKQDAIIPEYLHLVLKQYYFYGYTFDMQTGSSGLKNLDMNKYLMLPIPIPPKNIQKLVVDESGVIDKEYDKTRMTIPAYSKKIEEMLHKHSVINTQDNAKE